MDMKGDPIPKPRLLTPGSWAILAGTYVTGAMLRGPHINSVTIPHLTPAVDSFASLFSPVGPLLFAFFLTFFIAIWRRKTVKGWDVLFSHLTFGLGYLSWMGPFWDSKRVMMSSLGTWGVGEERGICGITECGLQWAEQALTLFVCVGCGMGWRWGYFGWADELAKEITVWWNEEVDEGESTVA